MFVLFLLAGRNAALIDEAFANDVKYFYLRHMFTLMSISIKTIGKFRVRTWRERIGLCFTNATSWGLFGEASNAINVKKKVIKIIKYTII